MRAGWRGRGRGREEGGEGGEGGEEEEEEGRRREEESAGLHLVHLRDDGETEGGDGGAWRVKELSEACGGEVRDGGNRGRSSEHAVELRCDVDGAAGAADGREASGDA